MKAFFLFILFSFAIFNTQAQCGGRYESEIFQEVSTQTLTYSTGFSLDVDIYTPDGDTETNRPLVILAHGGAFVSGNKTNPLMVSLAESLAKRGYVAASISYRLVSPLAITQPSQYIDGVAKGISDGKAAIRFFYKSVEDGNVYGIDTTQIYFCGNSAGGVIGLHNAFLDVSDVLDNDLQTALDNNGGIEGNSGNAGYSSKLAGMISLAGGIADVNFINESGTNTLLISAHGDNDDVVPFNCGQPLGNAQLPELCGGGAIKTRFTSLDYSKHYHKTYTGEGHTPWNTNATDEATMTDFVFEHLYANLPCAQAIDLAEHTSQFIEVYPNPTQSEIQLISESPIQLISVYSSTGLRLFQTTKSNIDIQHLDNGIYFLNVQLAHTTYTVSVVKK